MESAETHPLRQSIERSLRSAFDPSDVLPRLVRLARLAPEASDDAVFAQQKLAELLAERDPWRAALHVRRALAQRDDERSWAILAFCQTLLGNFRSAIAAYRKALASAPSNPWYFHNVGHLYDVGLGEPKRALAWLARAHGARPESTEIVTSYAHALARAGDLAAAKEIVERARQRYESRELDAVLSWLDEGAPSRRGRLALGGRKLRARSATPKRLAQVLARGLSHLPLDRRQRERALALARDALPERRRRVAREGRPDADADELAAAVAYAIVYVDHVPLSQAEVAAPFRVGVAGLRGRFAELRAKLDIIRGDARYATTRR